MSERELWSTLNIGNGRYRVSSWGRVYDDELGSVLNNHTNKQTGYVSVSLLGKEYYVHRLVATAFIINDEGKSQVNHMDGQKDNNKLSNLEWVTPSENIRHASETGLRDNNTPLQQKARSKTGRVTGKRLAKVMTERTKQKVEITEKLTGTTRVFDSGADASRYYGHTISWARGIINEPTREFSGRYLEVKPWNKDNTHGNSNGFQVYDKREGKYYMFTHAEYADKYFSKSRGYFSKIVRNGGENSYWKANYIS